MKTLLDDLSRVLLVSCCSVKKAFMMVDLMSTKSSSPSLMRPFLCRKSLNISSP